jgi:hypothetical protein
MKKITSAGNRNDLILPATGDKPNLHENKPYPPENLTLYVT